jgi:hypothetical protein
MVMVQSKVVIYTAIAGDIDKLIQHRYKSPMFDYVCFSDRPIKESGIWEIRQMQGSLLDLVRKAKYYKLFPHILFPNHLYSIWVDGNIDVLDDSLEKRVRELIDNDVTMAANKHPQRVCAYEEANACIEMKKDDPEVILRQVNFMRSNGLPRDLGLYALMIIFRKHHDDEVVQFMKQWWWMIKKFSRRDQISFMYVLYKSKMRPDILFEKDIYNHPAFSFTRHSVPFYSKLAVDTGGGFDFKGMSIKRFTSQKETELDLLFDLDTDLTVKRFRLIPFDTGVGKVKLKEIVLQGLDGQLEKVDLQKMKHNGVLQKDGFIVFRTFNPYFELFVDKQIGGIAVSGVFNVESRLVAEGILAEELEKLHVSFFRKVVRRVLRLPYILGDLSVKVLSLVFGRWNAKSN